MDNPTPIEKTYDAVNTRWRSLPAVRDNGRMQAAPGVLLIAVLWLLLGVVWFGISEAVAGEDRGVATAVFCAGWMISGLVVFCVLMARATIRRAEKDD